MLWQMTGFQYYRPVFINSVAPNHASELEILESDAQYWCKFREEKKQKNSVRPYIWKVIVKFLDLCSNFCDTNCYA